MPARRYEGVSLKGDSIKVVKEYLDNYVLEWHEYPDNKVWIMAGWTVNTINKMAKKDKIIIEKYAPEIYPKIIDELCDWEHIKEPNQYYNLLQTDYATDDIINIIDRLSETTQDDSQ